MTARKKILDKDTPFSEADIAYLRAIAEPRLKAIACGTARLMELDEAFEEIEADIARHSA